MIQLMIEVEVHGDPEVLQEKIDGNLKIDERGHRNYKVLVN